MKHIKCDFRSNAQNSTFTEHGHVAYEIKWTHKCSNMVANVLPVEPPPDPVGGLKIPLF